MSELDFKRDAQGFFPPATYAAIGDGRSTALVAPDGSIDWWCVPCLDAPPLFDRLLDAPDGGRFSVSPRALLAVERRYRDGSNVLETLCRTETGTARITESINSGPAGKLPWVELARRIETLAGEVQFDVCFQPGTHAGTSSPWSSQTPNGRVFYVDRLMIMCRLPGQALIHALTDRGLHAELIVRQGQRYTLALLAAEGEALPVPPIEDIDRRIDRSDREWREWSDELTYEGRYRELVVRSALSLKFLWYSATGGIVAAVTTSLPEQIGGTSNWDYRYAWVRDAAYTIKAFMRVGATADAKAAFSWLMRTIRAHGPGLRPCYTLSGGRVPQEREVDLPGYEDSKPVRAGNTATDQVQLCLYGDVFEMVWRFTESGHVLDLDTAAQLYQLANDCANGWQQKDSGFWELKDPQHYTISKIECWLALNRACALASQGHLPDTMLERWQREQQRILQWIDDHCWNEKLQAYTLHPDTPDLDASLVLSARFGFGDVRRERLIATRDAVRKHLEARDGMLYRRTASRKTEGTFIACSFWLVEAYGLLGEQEEATRLFEQLVEQLHGDLGLLSEMFDTKKRQSLGNFPQGLSHLALIHAAFSTSGQ